MTPLEAIRAKCLDCSAGNTKEIKHCPIENCALYLFRGGKKPKTERHYSPEEAEQLAARFKLKNS